MAAKLSSVAFSTPITRFTSKKRSSLVSGSLILMLKVRCKINFADYSVLQICYGKLPSNKVGTLAGFLLSSCKISVLLLIINLTCTWEVLQKVQICHSFSEIGWSEWVLQPVGFTTKYCNGDCPGLPLDRNHMLPTVYTICKTATSLLHYSSLLYNKRSAKLFNNLTLLVELSAHCFASKRVYHDVLNNVMFFHTLIHVLLDISDISLRVNIFTQVHINSISNL